MGKRKDPPGRSLAGWDESADYAFAGRGRRAGEHTRIGGGVRNDNLRAGTDPQRPEVVSRYAGDTVFGTEDRNVFGANRIGVPDTTDGDGSEVWFVDILGGEEGGYGGTSAAGAAVGCWPSPSGPACVWRH